MTPADRLLAALAQARGLVAALEQALAELDDADSAPAPRVVDTSAAMKIVKGRSQSWLYSVGRAHPQIGWKLDSGSWRWDAEALRLFMAGESYAREDCDRAANSATESDSIGGPRAT